MQCEQVEKRLNQLLDRRREWVRDREVVAHCAACEPCRSIAEAYATFENRGEQVPALAPDFATRVLAELRPISLSEEGRRSKPESATRGRSSWAWFAVAAAVLVAISIGFRNARSPQLADPLQSSSTMVAKAWPLHVELDQLLGDDRQFSEVVWQSTGREFAKLPHQVRRAADLTESSQLTGAIRPVAAAWQSLRRVLPGESMRSEPATGETSFYVVAEVQFV